MDTRSLLGGVLTVLLLGLLAPHPLSACLCSPLVAACETAWSVEAVFVGQVLDFEQLPRPAANAPPKLETSSMRVRVLERFRGDVDEEVVLHVVSGPCLTFVGGSTYLFYAHRLPSGFLTASPCTRTRGIHRAADDLAYLRTLASPPAVAWAEGTVRVGATPSEESAPAGGVRISLASDAGTFVAESAADGRYRIEVHPGRYRLSVSPPEGFYIATSLADTVDLPNAGSCVERSVDVYADGRAMGRVVDAEGRPVPFFSVFFASENDPYRYAPANGFTDAAGIYEVTRIAPGRYRFGAGRRANRTGPAAVWHPGGRDLNEAALFDIGLSERKVLPDLMLPADSHLVTFGGRVSDSRGRPLAGATVHLWHMEPGMRPKANAATYPVTTGADGTYRLTTFAGRYGASASRRADDGRFRNADTGPFEASAGGRVDIVLPD